MQAKQPHEQGQKRGINLKQYRITATSLALSELWIVVNLSRHTEIIRYGTSLGFH